MRDEDFFQQNLVDKSDPAALFDIRAIQEDVRELKKTLYSANKDNSFVSHLHQYHHLNYLI